MVQFEPVIYDINPLKLAHPNWYCPGSELPARRRNMTWLQCSNCGEWKLSSTRIRLPAHLLEFHVSESVKYVHRKWQVAAIYDDRILLFDRVTDEFESAIPNEIRPTPKP